MLCTCNDDISNANPYIFLDTVCECQWSPCLTERNGHRAFCGKGSQSHIFGGSKGVRVTIESYGKVEISYINVYNF
jgi:hypothetical protein